MTGFDAHPFKRLTTINTSCLKSTVQLSKSATVIQICMTDHDPVQHGASQAAKIRSNRIGKGRTDRKSTRLNSSHVRISYAVFCLKKKKKTQIYNRKKKKN